MKSSLLILFALAFGFAACAPADDLPEVDKEDKAEQECNALYPYPGYEKETSREKVIMSVVTAERISYKNSSIGCNLNCVLQKVGFLDNESNMRAPGVFKYNMKELPELAKYADVLMIELFQIYRSTKNMDDKCLKAFIAYHQTVNSLFVLTMANAIENNFNVKEVVMKAVEEGKPIPDSIKNKIKDYLKAVNHLIKVESAQLKAIATDNANQLPSQSSAPAVPATVL